MKIKVFFTVCLFVLSWEVVGYFPPSSCTAYAFLYWFRSRE
jgi:hypothetical protein